MFEPTEFKDPLETFWKLRIKRGRLRFYCKTIVESKTFTLGMWVALLIAVGFSLGVNYGDPLSDYFNYLTIVMFIGEMVIKWIVDGFYIYFWNFLNFIDFLNRGHDCQYHASAVPILTKFRIIRLIKLPSVMKVVSKSHR